VHLVNICVKNQQIHKIINSVYYVGYLPHVSALHCHLQGASLVPSERLNTPIHNILSTAPRLNIFQKALGTLPEDGNVILKHVGATIHN
jgi:hypothetical protein